MRTNGFRIALLTVCASAVVVGAALSSPGADDARVKKELMAVFDKSIVRFKAKDIKGFMSDYTDDFTGMSMEGRKLTKKSAEAEMKQAMEDTKSLEKAKMTIDKLSVKGNTVTTEGTMTLDMHVIDRAGQMGPKGNVHAMRMIMRSKDDWIKTQSGWKAKHSEPLPGSKVTVDGKPFPPTPPTPKKK